MTDADFRVLRASIKVDWKRLAELLGVTERTLRRWRQGEGPVPAWVPAAAEGLICRVLHQGQVLKEPKENGKIQTTTKPIPRRLLL